MNEFEQYDHQPRRAAARLGLIVLGAATLWLAAAGPLHADGDSVVISRAEIDEIEREIAFMDKSRPPRPSKGEKTLTCGDDYCLGLYEDLVSYRWEADTGYSGIRVATEIESYLAASSHGCSSTTSIIMKAAHETSANKNATVSRWVAELLTAQVMGFEIQLRWRQSNFSGWPVCILDRFYTWPPPEPITE